MADIVDKATRSRMMSGIRGKNTAPEMILRRAMHRMGYRFRIHVRELPGEPDLVFPRFKAVVFVHGCFWHRHVGCRYATTPASNIEFWKKKFENTLKRDKSVHLMLQENDWRIATVWECAMRKDDVYNVVRQLADWMESKATEIELSAQK